MKYVDYFKLQAKNLFKDFKTGKSLPGSPAVLYSPEFFVDIAAIVTWLKGRRDAKWFSETDVTLMQTQQIIAMLAGFKKWGELIEASEAKLELGKLLLNGRGSADTFPLADAWNTYLMNREPDTAIDDEGCLVELEDTDESLLELFKYCFPVEYFPSEDELRYFEERANMTQEEADAEMDELWKIYTGQSAE